MDPTLFAAMMQGMQGTGGAGAFGPTAATLGSGTYGLESAGPGVFGLASQGQGPMAMGAAMQGTGPIMGQALTADDATLAKLTNAPIDPNKLMQLLDAGQGQRGGMAGSGSAGPGPHTVQTVDQKDPSTHKFSPLSLAAILGGK